MDQDKLIEMRVTGIGDASSRARIAFFTSIFVCGTILVALYNNYFNWNRILLAPHSGLSTWIPKEPLTKANSPSKPARFTDEQFKDLLADEKIREDRRKQLVLSGQMEDAKEQIENQGINLAWLGIKVSSADLDIFGSCAVFITSMYYLLSVRRMSVDVESLLKSASGMDHPAREYIFNGVRQSLVLNVGVDQGLGTPPGTSAPGVSLSRWLFSRLIFLPTVTVAINAISDWYFVSTHTSPGGEGWRWLTNLQPEFRFQFYFMNVTAIAIGIAILLLNLDTRRLQGAMVRHILEFESLLEGTNHQSDDLGHS